MNGNPAPSDEADLRDALAAYRDEMKANLDTFTQVLPELRVSGSPRADFIEGSQRLADEVLGRLDTILAATRKPGQGAVRQLTLFGTDPI